MLDGIVSLLAVAQNYTQFKVGPTFWNYWHQVQDGMQNRISGYFSSMKIYLLVLFFSLPCSEKVAVFGKPNRYSSFSSNLI